MPLCRQVISVSSDSELFNMNYRVPPDSCLLRKWAEMPRHNTSPENCLSSWKQQLTWKQKPRVVASSFVLTRRIEERKDTQLFFKLCVTWRKFFVDRKWLNGGHVSLNSFVAQHCLKDLTSAWLFRHLWFTWPWLYVHVHLLGVKQCSRACHQRCV